MSGTQIAFSPKVDVLILSSEQESELAGRLNDSSLTHDASWSVDGAGIALTIDLDDGTTASYVDNTYHPTDSSKCSDVTP